VRLGPLLWGGGERDDKGSKKIETAQVESGGGRAAHRKILWAVKNKGEVKRRTTSGAGRRGKKDMNRMLDKISRVEGEGGKTCLGGKETRNTL